VGDSYVILCDLATWGYIPHSVPADMLPHMYFLYHKTLPPKELHMPKGEFFPRLIPQPLIYRTGTVTTPNAPPRQDLVLITISNKEQWTPMSDWTDYEDAEGNHCLRNEV
jgi:hypothetical protein